MDKIARKVVEAKCPNCSKGFNVTFFPQTDYAFCPYCGKKYKVTHSEEVLRGWQVDVVGMKEVEGSPRIAGISICCPSCSRVWHSVVEKSPYYSNCPYCGTEYKVKFSLELCEMEFVKLIQKTL